MTIESIRGSPLNICTVDEIIDDDHVIIRIRGVLQYLVGVASFVDRDLLEPNCSVLVNPIVILPTLSHDSPPSLWASFPRTRAVRWT